MKGSAQGGAFKEGMYCMSIFNAVALLGGLAMFLYGMSLMSEKLEKLAGGKLEQIFEKLTSSRFKAVVLGIVITAVVQSSSATTVMLVGFANSGLMRLSQAIPVIMGSHIGTTITTWVLSLAGLEGEGWIQLLKPTTFAPVIALVGVIMRMTSKHDRKKDIGGIAVGFALLMMGMSTMQDAVSPLQDSPEFAHILTVFTNPVMGIIVGALVTAIVQSSAASIGMLQALANSTKSFSFNMALPIILGQNIGTCITAMLSSIGTNKNAKRVAASHLMINSIGAVVILVIYCVSDMLFDFAFGDTLVTGFTISLIHTAFNIINTVMMLPLCGVIEKLAYVLVKDTEDSHSPESLVVLDERFLSTPGVAIEQCRNVTNRMASISKNTICLSLDLFRSYDEDKAEMIVMEEETVDRYEDLIGTYLVKLSGRSLTAADNRRVSLLLHAIGDFERISDHAVNIMDSAKEINDKELEFSSGAKRELDVLFRALEDILDLTVKAFSEQDVSLAKKIEPVEEVIDHLCAEMKDRHIDRLQNKVCTIEQGFVFTDMLTNIERVSDHCSNIAVNIIQMEDVDIVRHQYLHDLKSEDNEEFVAMYDEYSLKYLLPQE